MVFVPIHYGLDIYSLMVVYFLLNGSYGYPLIVYLVMN